MANDLSSRSAAIRIVAIYALFGLLWILFSDQLLLVFMDSGLLLAVSTAKGWLFVAVTAWLLYSLIVTELKKREVLQRELIERAVEKEVLLKEIHHRVKNNLQVVSSILNLERERINAESGGTLLDELNAKILSMSMIHERFYLSGDLSKINLADYLRDLGGEIAEIFGGRNRLSYSLEDISIGLDLATPCGLIAAEALANAARYGKGSEARISLSLAPDGYVVLEIRDAGPGFPEGEMRIAERKSGLGFVLMEALAAQLEGELSAFNDGGAVVRLRFPLPAARNGEPSPRAKKDAVRRNAGQSPR